MYFPITKTITLVLLYPTRFLEMTKNIPNLITCCNLLCGAIAVWLAIENRLDVAVLFMVLGIFFDFFDGLAARALHVKSDVGLQLDSLADVITSGLVPAIIMVQLLYAALSTSSNTMIGYTMSLENPIPLIGLLIAAASAYRLAKFNVDTRQTDSFIGLPTPANALLIGSLPLILAYQPSEIITSVILNPWVLAVLICLSCYLLNANLPLFSLKFKNFSWKANSVRYVFLSLSIILLLLLKFIAIPFIIVLYVLFSLKKKK